MAAASTGMRIAGVVAAVSSGVWFDVFLTQPYGSLAIRDRNDIEATVLLVIIGAAVTEIALWGYRQQAQASRRAGYLDGVLGTAEIVALRHKPPRSPSPPRRGADRAGPRHCPVPIRARSVPRPSQPGR